MTFTVVYCLLSVLNVRTSSILSSVPNYCEICFEETNKKKQLQVSRYDTAEIWGKNAYTTFRQL